MRMTTAEYKYHLIRAWTVLPRGQPVGFQAAGHGSGTLLANERGTECVMSLSALCTGADRAGGNQSRCRGLSAVSGIQLSLCWPVSVWTMDTSLIAFIKNGPETDSGGAFLLRNVKWWGILQRRLFMEEICPQANSDMLVISLVYTRSPCCGTGRDAVGSPVHKETMLNIKWSAKTGLPALTPW